MNPRDSILLDYSYLREGETVTGELCPACRGGINNDHALAVSRRDGRLLWVCYRASCGFKGASTGSVGYTGTTPVNTRGATGRWISREADSLPERVATLLHERYYIGPEQVGKWKLGWHDNRLVLPVLNVAGEDDGCTMRSFDGAKPKSLSHTEPEALAWYRNRASDSLVIVEDQLSAIRASKYVNAVALLGTNLNQSRATEIRKARFSNVMLALDADAFEKAVSYARKYRSYLPLTLLRLDKDIKDMKDEEVQQLLKDN